MPLNGSSSYSFSSSDSSTFPSKVLPLHQIKPGLLFSNQLWVPIAPLLTIIFIFYSSIDQVSCRGGAITRGSGGAKGPHRRYNENEETDTLGVILVVILPVAQMIAVLTIIVLLRICYRRYCSPARSILLGPTNATETPQVTTINHISTKLIPSQC
ncbi:uncharacterized protein LOC107372003 [Tetranychus urticae]|uniref:Uncharacterized protein n=1 Tax=Tetranychus urticae TaxID=32264 RepID=T1JZG5_TETUR|nr:uncharacterized protein LOC107372003 [Tetranychus urticae]